MFPNLLAEMARNDITQEQLQIATGRNKSTISEKLNGKREFTLVEIKNIRDKLFPNLSLDYLFEIKK